MDKRSIMGFVLIGVILIGWLYFQSMNSNKEQQKKDLQTKQIQDSLSKLQPKDTVRKEAPKDTAITKIAPKDSTGKLGMLFSRNETGTPKNIIIETDKYYAEFSTKGGALIKYEVKGFKTWDGFPVQLVKLDKGGELNLIFTSNDGKMINTKDLYFNASYDPWQRVDLLRNGEFKVVYELPVGDTTVGAKVVKTFTFRNNSYLFDMDVELVNSNKFLANFEYQFAFENSLKLTEYRSDVEGNYAEAFSYMGDELDIVDATKNDEQKKSDLNGNAEWVVSRTKYFCVGLISKGQKATGSYITGLRTVLPENGFEEHYSIALKNTIKNDKNEKQSYSVYIGPVDYEILKSYNVGLEKTMRFSLDFIVRPIAQYAILPFFLFLHKFISNWGIVIIIFSIVMKVVLTPFTRFQMKSMRKMSELQPKMNAMKEKYKDDPKKQQEMLMKLYKEEKINPAGGCLPLLLQLPILYALFGAFSSTIELRQAHFFGWIKDLAIPDIILALPFKIPIFGIHEISGLAILMGATMFVQQKMNVKDPSQKAMVYIMPVMLTLLFMTLPSGLNLYYFTFNLLSIVEQYFITKKKPTDTPSEPAVVTGPRPQLRYKGKK
jgi:YidC/Oxa1 family membrane protein insertase